jgi:uncharacterized membrane protein HdeD (DUF308 family)
MGDKIRGVIAILFGAVGVVKGFLLYQAGHRDAKLLVALAGVVLIALGIWRVRRKPVDPVAELLK